MRIGICVAGLLIVATAALGQVPQPTITSITPNSVAVAGGTKVVIKGTGFSADCVACSPTCFGCVTPDVSFGGTPAAKVTFIDSTTLEAVTPPLMPGTMFVSVLQRNLTGVTVFDALTATGDPLTAFEPVLFPIFLPPVRGQFGSEFKTEARLSNKGASRPLFVYGDDTSCYLFSPIIPISSPIFVESDGAEKMLLTGCSKTTGRILYAPRADAPLLAFGLRVFDTSRAADSAGTEIPVVRERDFSTNGIALLNVPVRPKFRNMLRIYALSNVDYPVVVRVGSQAVSVILKAGADHFEPAYVELADFQLPAIPDKTSVTVRVEYPAVTSPSFVKAPLWAFVTSTNAETQQITVVTPN